MTSDERATGRPVNAMRADVSRAIATLLADVAPRDLAAAARDVSDRYRDGTGSELRSDADALAYVATRLPATAGAARVAMEHVRERNPGFAPLTQVDLGAGPGAAAWAAATVWPSIRAVVLRERDDRMIRAGEQLSEGQFEGSWTWQRAELRDAFEVADLVTASYALGELDGAEAADVALRSWEATTGCLVIVEPGTPSGFALIRRLREHLVSNGATLVAPCPNTEACPIAGDDWCHFSARISRSSLHRKLKGGELSYEDEKFSYIAFARHADVIRAAGRIVRRPSHRRRFVELSVCHGGQIRRIGLGRSHPGYGVASKLAWGDSVPGTVLDDPRRDPRGG
jgi:ribosomal protein RSM22 (predicted rRNA methylase)